VSVPTANLKTLHLSGRQPSMPPLALLFGALLVIGCGESVDPPGPVISDTAKTVEDTQDTAQAAAPDTAGVGQVRWRQHIPAHGKKLRAMARQPGKKGSYAIAGDSASVVLFVDGKFTDVSPENLGGANLSGVHVDDKGRVVVAGEKSALAILEDGTWSVAGEVPPAPAVQFLDVSGFGAKYWAVGVAAQAWKHEDETWVPQAVTVTGDTEWIGVGAQFVAVAVHKDEVWIACDPGVTSPGLALRKTAKGWTSYPLKTSPRDIWIAPDKVDGGVFVAGGTASEYVARFDGKAFVADKNLKWKQGFHAVRGLTAAQVWAAGLKGQLRQTAGAAWDVVAIEAPPGTPNPFPPPTDDLVGIGVHAPDALAVITNYRMYSYGTQ
jgi:hypothetical protein